MTLKARPFLAVLIFNYSFQSCTFTPGPIVGVIVSDEM
jgi:hypothetical protein